MASTPSLLERLSALWSEVESHRPSEATEANLHLMKTLSELLSADYAYWCGLARSSDEEVAPDDPLGGWRVCATEPYVLPEVYSQNADELLENQHLAETVGMASIAIMSEAGRFRVRLLRELVDLSEYEQSGHFEKYQMPYGLTDRVYVVTPTSKRTESCYVFELAGQGRRFEAGGMETLGLGLRGLWWFQRRLTLSLGLHAQGEPLNPMERTIVQWLLTGRPEKEIAEQIDRAHSTTHNYITGIYRKLGVHNRAGLMAILCE